jgi:hypothetical protein
MKGGQGNSSMELERKEFEGTMTDDQISTAKYPKISDKKIKREEDAPYIINQLTCHKYNMAQKMTVFL